MICIANVIQTHAHTDEYALTHTHAYTHRQHTHTHTNKLRDGVNTIFKL